MTRAADGALTFAYSVEGDLSRICVPPPRPERRTDGLWRHTCFEAFIALDPGPSYLELNFSPSGEWAGYTFSDYRTDMAVANDIDTPRIRFARPDGRRMTLEAAVRVPALRSGAAARVALAAVVEESGGSLSYWALQHPLGKPDFHHPRGFALPV